jgi:hypothetical protein
MQQPADFPSIAFDTLWHVGSMNPADKGTASYEGQGLSVSVHPEDWAAIARLGNNPTWVLTRPGGALLDAHALTDAQRDGIEAWGHQQGFVEPAQRWIVEFWDEDLDDTVTMTCLTREEADAEAEFRISADDSPATVREVTRFVATPAFPDPTVQPGASDIFEPLTALWVSAHRRDLDGVWFADRYDPATLSCPRGVLAVDRVAGWNPTVLTS